MKNKSKTAPPRPDRIFFYTMVGAPFVAALAVALATRTLLACVAGVLVFFIVAWVDHVLYLGFMSHVARLQWAKCIEPGFAGEPEFTVFAKGERVLDSFEASMSGPMVENWLTADGAIVVQAIGGLHRCGGKRYLAASTDPNFHAFVVLDQVEHVRYQDQGEHVKASFGDLFWRSVDNNSVAAKAKWNAAFDALLQRATAVPLLAYRGLRLPENEIPVFPDRLIERAMGPGLILSATRIGPEDASTLADPLKAIANPLRRLAVNGTATPFWCRDLATAMAAPDGAACMVAGMVIDASTATLGERWYLCNRAEAWATLDDNIYDAYGDPIGSLNALVSFGAGEAMFRIRLDRAGMRAGWVQASFHSAPIKVRFKAVNGAVTCKLSLMADLLA